MMMMRVIRNGFLAFCLAMVAASQVSAADPIELRERKPGYALAAAGMNVLYFPVRLVVTIFGAELSGLTGFFTAGNQNAAGDVASLFDGTHYIKPEHVEGTEPIRFGPPEFP
jgi:hypothetical protein